MKKRFLTLAFLVVMVAALLTVSAFALTINDATTTGPIADSAITAGTAEWDANTATLTLTNATIEGDVYFSWSLSEATVKLVGQNTIIGDDPLYAECDLTIVGANRETDTLTVTSSFFYGIYTNDLLIEDCTLVVTAAEYDGISTNNDISIDNATVNISNTLDEGLDGDNVTITNGSTVTITNAGGEGLEADDGDLTITDSTVTITNVDEDGIEVEDGDLFITNSTVTISGTGDDGIWVDADFLYDDDTGMETYLSGGAMTVTNSTVNISDTEDDGIQLDYGTLQILDSSIVTLTDIETDALDVDDGDIIVTDSTVTITSSEGITSDAFDVGSISDEEGNYLSGGCIRITDSTVTITGMDDQGLDATNDVEITGSIIAIIDVNDGIDNGADLSIVDSSVTIQTVEDYGIYNDSDVTIVASDLLISDAYYGMDGLDMSVSNSTLEIWAKGDAGIRAWGDVIFTNVDFYITGVSGAATAYSFIIDEVVYGSVEPGAKISTLQVVTLFTEDIGDGRGLQTYVLNGAIACTISDLGVAPEQEFDFEFLPFLDEELPFNDIPERGELLEAIRYVYKSSLMVGTATDKFSPDATLTRAMIWTVLARAEGVNTAVNPGEAWYATAQTWAMHTGVSDGTNPEGAVTKLEMVTMLWRFMGCPGAAADVDVTGVPEWGVEALRWAVEQEMISADGWNQPATRGETALALYLA